MAYHEPRKEFAAERQLKIRRLGRENGVGNADLLHAIQELREEVAGLRQAQTTRTTEIDDDHPVFTESLEVRVEIAQMVRMIGRAKLEIASIKHPMAEEDDRMKLAAGELDAIVVATEASTQDILAASERMEILARTITGLHPDDEEVAELGEQMANEIIKMFDACNFQDITGQRINKVVKTIHVIEEKILAMINIWGAEAFIDLPVASDPSASGDDPLMNGPQLENQGITQDEINALFD